MNNTNARNALWIDLSAALFRQTIPFDVRSDLQKMTRAQHASLVDREQRRVDAAIVRMALASGQTDVDHILAALSRDTVTALASRWAHHQAQWKEKANKPSLCLWFPPTDRDVWRVIVLSLLSDQRVAASHLKSLWPGEFSEFQD